MKQGKPGFTARFIARSMILLSQEEKYKTLCPEEDEPFYRAILDRLSGGRDRFIALFKFSFFRRIIFFLEKIIFPGIFVHYGKRKQLIRSLVEKGIEEGFQQLVVIGAGYDVLTLHIRKKYPSVACTETDYSFTASEKQRILKLGDLPLEGIRFQIADLRKLDSEDLKRGKKISWEEPTLIVAEGLFMHMELPAVQNMLTVLSFLFVNQSRFIFTFMEPDEKNEIHFSIRSRLVDFWLSMRDEQLRSGIAKEKLLAFLQSSGWSPVAIMDPDIEDAGFPPQKSMGEYLCVAER